MSMPQNNPFASMLWSQERHDFLRAASEWHIDQWCVPSIFLVPMPPGQEAAVNGVEWCLPRNDQAVPL
jgi:hypothetical protein